MSGLQMFREQVLELIKARTPIFYLGSIETSQILKELRIIARAVGRTMGGGG